MMLDKDENIENTKPEGEAKEDGQYGKLNQQWQNHLKVIIPETITKKYSEGEEDKNNKYTNMTNKLETTHLKLHQAGLKTLPN